MKYIVVLNINSSKWKVLDVSFPTCPSSPVKYSDISLYNPVPILEKCPNVEIINQITNAKGTGTPIKIS